MAGAPEKTTNFDTLWAENSLISSHTSRKSRLFYFLGVGQRVGGGVVVLVVCGCDLKTRHSALYRTESGDQEW